MRLTEILDQPRWAALRRFVDTWYAEPLGDPGLTEADLAAAEARLGQALPIELREWFLLVGHRLRDVNQDSPVKLTALKLRGDRLPIWEENQAVWTLDAELGSAGDTWASVEGDAPEWSRRAPLPHALLGMLHSDTFAGAASGEGFGPLGRLRPEVTGGIQPSDSAEIEARFLDLPELDVMTNPFLEGALRGHAALVIRWNDAWEWMAATPEAYREADEVLALSDPSVPRILIVAFEPVPASLRPDSKIPRSVLGDLGRVRSTALPWANDRVTFEIETHRPAELFDAILRAVPEAAQSARAGWRLEGASRVTPVWPK